MIVRTIRKRPVTSAFVIIAVTSFVVLAVFGWALHTVRESTKSNREFIRQVAVLAKQGKESHDAQCVFKADLHSRILRTQAFIDHPPQTIIGIRVTPEVIVQAKTQLAGQTATYASLKGLHCRPAPKT